MPDAAEDRMMDALRVVGIKRKTGDSDWQTALDYLLGLLDRLAPPEPMNQDEQGGCVWCDGAVDGSLYATADPKDHRTDCPWVEARRLVVFVQRD